MLRIQIGLFAGVVFPALFALFFWALGGFPSSEKAKAFTHMHCSECGLEVTYNPALEGKFCPHCGAGGPKMVSTVGPGKGSDQADNSTVGAVGNVLAALVVALAVSVSSLYGLILLTANRRRAAEEARNRLRVCHCPFCSRKIGYSVREVGTTGICPRCKTAFMLPDGVELQEDTAAGRT